ncbi:isochorismatase family cysteine hydrolase [Salimicrobium sp. PL1-032A]|uniref:cysteine hydrolase family protein n=1 Tax=Salimicrobium sp. PL1-032A TaxID=3095364 RepID=UPI003261BBD3
MHNPSQSLYEDYKTNPFIKGKVALLCIDLQYYDAAPGYGFFKDMSREDAADSYYFNRLEEKVFPSVAELQAVFREQGQEVIHVKIESMTEDGRDRSLEHKRIGCFVEKGSKESEFIKEVEPADDEIIITKTASGVFNSTNIDYVLRNLGIEQIVVVGVLTNECVETTVRDGADKGYEMYVMKEGVAALTEALDHHSLDVMHGVYADVLPFETIKNNF